MKEKLADLAMQDSSLLRGVRVLADAERGTLGRLEGPTDSEVIGTPLTFSSTDSSPEGPSPDSTELSSGDYSCPR
jgi:hypothetical protein